ncbi:MAG: hypothetical protein KGJ84_11045 [Elusimicrobia bacterium]|nr:hypothetical protein [Elusimicrobiota bacterium]
MSRHSLVRFGLAAALPVLLITQGARAEKNIDFDQGISAPAALQRARTAAGIRLRKIEHVRAPIRPFKFDRKIVGPGVYPPVSPLITGSAAYRDALNLHADPRYLTLDPNVLKPLEGDWARIGSIRSDLLAQASTWEGDNGNLYSGGQQLESDRAALDQRKSDINTEIDQYNQQCTTHPLPPDQYQQCLNWQSSLNARQNQLNSDISAFNGQVDSWNQLSQAILQRRNDIVLNIQNWEATVKSWTNSVHKALAAQCRPLKQLDVTPHAASVPTGGLPAVFTARTLFQADPAAAPACPVDLLWTFTPHPDIPNTVIGTIAPTKGATTTITSGNFTGLGTLVVQDVISGVGTSANVNVYNPAVR